MYTYKKWLKYCLELHFIHLHTTPVKITLLKSASIWATFTTQLILRLKLSVMKRVVQQDTIIGITVWEE